MVNDTVDRMSSLDRPRDVDVSNYYSVYFLNFATFFNTKLMSPAADVWETSSNSLIF